MKKLQNWSMPFANIKAHMQVRAQKSPAFEEFVDELENLSTKQEQFIGAVLKKVSEVEVLDPIQDFFFICNLCSRAGSLNANWWQPSSCDTELLRQMHLQTEDLVLGENTNQLQKFTLACHAHIDGSSQAVKRFAAMLGIPEPKP